MTEPYLGEIQIFAFDYAPYGWSYCNGALLPITQNSALFSLLGVQYGGNGSSTFQLPNLAARGACATGTGPGLTPHTMGETFGTAEVTLDTAQMPMHRHTLTAYIPADASKRSSTPVSGGALAMPGLNANKPFGGAEPATPSVPMNPQMLQPAGGGQPHSNQQPYLAVNFCIALTGNYPVFS